MVGPLPWDCNPALGRRAPKPERFDRKKEFLTPRGTKAGQGVEKVGWDALIESHRSVN